MKYQAIIEIPKGSDRRIHMSDDGSGFKDFGPINEKIPINNGIMPVCYGYIVDTINKSEGDNVDVIVFSNLSYETGDKIEIEVIGLMNREDGDHKVISTDNSVSLTNFLEVEREERKLILDYFSYTHNIKVESKDKALVYLNTCRV